MTLVIAHRGEPVQFRENTLAALRAGAAAGADALEIDLKLTADGHVVLLHDDTPQRLWGRATPVAQLTLTDLAELGDGADRRIPTLLEVLMEFARPGAPALMLDVSSIEVALATDDLVVSQGRLDYVLYSGPTDAMRALRARRPQAHLCLSWEHRELPSAELWQAIQPRFYNAYWPLLSHELVADLHRHGYGVSAWTCNDTSAMARLVGMGIDALITDYPSDLIKVLRAHGQRR
ncbi:glycerophosphodiester phosphodiesterase [Salinactinospora qingdaonensis]|uniref:Glycerophosphodiester phosphodiesterase n=1 Tax=Salinactinospora qingdaonensis TaxID=702744 RepID=A0ABP7FAQ7_9ACTN